MNSSTDAIANGRMRCDKYSADIPVSTCLARQRRNVHSGTKWGGQGGFCFDPGCHECSQGKMIMVKFGGLKDEPVAKKKTTDTPKTKTCKKCGVEKDRYEFYVSHGFRDNRDSTCKECRNLYHKEYHRARVSKKAHEKDAVHAQAKMIEGGADAFNTGRTPASAADQISIQRTQRETVMIDVGIQCFEHIEIVIRPRKPKKEKRHV